MLVESSCIMRERDIYRLPGVFFRRLTTLNVVENLKNTIPLRLLRTLVVTNQQSTFFHLVSVPPAIQLEAFGSICGVRMDFY